MPTTTNRRLGLTPHQRPHNARAQPAPVKAAQQKAREVRERLRHRDTPTSKAPMIVGGVIAAITLIIIVTYLLIGGPTGPQLPPNNEAPVTPAAPATPAATPESVTTPAAPMAPVAPVAPAPQPTPTP